MIPSDLQMQHRQNQMLQYSIRRSLRAPKSMSCLDYRKTQSLTHDAVSNQNGTINPIRETPLKGSFRRLKSHSSMFFRTKHRQQGGSLETSTSRRNSSDNSAALSSAFSGNTTAAEKPAGIRFTVRRVSRTVRNKLGKLFSQSKNTDTGGNETRTNQLHDTDSDSFRHLTDTSPAEEASMSKVTSHVPSLHAVPSYQQMRSRQGSLESIQYDENIDLDDKSRITSWTNSTANTVVSYGTSEEREYQRLSVIKENGMHIPSSSHIGHQEHAASAVDHCVPTFATNSQRVYSALMKKLKNDSNAENNVHKLDSVHVLPDKTVPPRQSSLDRTEAWSPATVRGIGTDDDDVFEDSREVASPRVDSSSRGSKDEVDGESTSRKSSYKAYPDPTAGDGRGLSPTKIPLPESASKQPSKQTDKNSMFSPSLNNYFFRTTSPYRRALQRSMNEHQDTEHTHALDTRYLSTLSALSLPTRRPSTMGSKRDLRLTYAESFYSFTTDDLTTSCPAGVTSSPVVENTMENAESDHLSSVPAPLHGHDVSAASSVEWKTWLSAHVSKLETPCTTMASQCTETPGVAMPSPRHVRESAEIESPAEVPQLDAPQAIQASPLGEGSGNIKGPYSVGARTLSKKSHGMPLKSTMEIVENNGRNGNKISQHSLSSTIPPIPCRNILRAVPSLPNVDSEVASKPGKRTASIPRMRSLNNIPTFVPLSLDTSYYKRRGQENKRRDALTSSKSTPRLDAAAHQDYLGGKTGSPVKRGINNSPASPHTPDDTAFASDNIQVTAKSDWDAQIRGSRRMVDLFLSSRRRAIQGPMSRNGSENFSAAFM
ncbi:hypothetical protein QQS21_008215 [Conoideocrella luteorostrata]|uniref:Uncharacterized protein n=1 Tax=Conoideocrella luteorostrata TaxID=1105319 RepID=A0AAJ0CNM7_9HYPO|nr:hypothetical protein QQS21_008215 [Conoideocrella luteorostrata]